MIRDPVASSNIAAIGYDPGSETLEIEFTNGVTIRRVPRLFDLHAVPSAMFCCFFQFQGSNS